MRTAEVLTHGRENNFNAIRIAAALAVIVSHSYPIALGPTAVEPLHDLLGFSLGALGVKIFFVISGFLILKSFMNRKSTGAFAMARVRRIFPGLAVVALLAAFLLGPLLTSRPVTSYLTDPATLAYVPNVLSLVRMQYTLPGVFELNPYPNAVNGPLWTLPLEVYCYVGLALAGLIGFYRPRLFPLLLAAFVPVYVVIRYGLLPLDALVTLAILSFPFLLGMAAYFYRARLPIDWRLMLALAALAAAAVAADVLREEMATVAIGYAALWLGAADHKLLRSYNRIGDYSYGVYIYGWPMQQIAILAIPGLSPFQLTLAASLGALFCAVLSWHFVEKPALTWRRTVRPTEERDSEKPEGGEPLEASRQGAYW